MKENATEEATVVELLHFDRTTTTSPTSNNAHLITTTTTNREPKRYKVKSKTELITLGNEPEENDSPKQDHHYHHNHHHHHNDVTKPSSDNDVVLTPSVGMSIQERLAALKKNGEEDWKKRNNDNTSNANDTEKRINIVKQQKEQLQHQLHMAVPKPLIGSGLTSSQFKHQGPISVHLQNDQFNIDKEFETNANKLSSRSFSNESLDNLTEANSQNQQRSKQVPIGKRVIFSPSDNINRNKPVKPITRMNSAGSDTDSMFARNQAMVNNNKKSSSQRHTTSHVETNRVELFSTDSEMDSFFKENETIVNKNKSYNNNNTDLLSSSTSPKTDEMTINEDLEDDQEFDRIVSEAQRLTQGTRAKPSRKAKSKGNHLKNMQNRIEIQNEYEQQSMIATTPPASSTGSFLTQQQYQQKQQNLIANELATNKKFDKSSVFDY
jgi:hypothetical protein